MTNAVTTAGQLTAAAVGRQWKRREQITRRRVGWSRHWYRLDAVEYVPRPGAEAGDAVRLTFHHDVQPEAVYTLLALASDRIKLKEKS